MLGGMLLFVLVHLIITDGFTYPCSVNGFAKAIFFYVVLIIFYWQKLKNVSHLQLSDHIKERMEQLLKMLQRNYRTEITFVVLFFLVLCLSAGSSTARAFRIWMTEVCL